MRRNRFSDQERKDLTEKALAMWNDMEIGGMHDTGKFRIIAEELNVSLNTVLTIIYNNTGEKPEKEETARAKVIARYGSDHFNPFIDLLPIAELSVLNVRKFEERLKLAEHPKEEEYWE
jgi:hypothetical protein